MFKKIPFTKSGSHSQYTDLLYRSHQSSRSKDKDGQTGLNFVCNTSERVSRKKNYNEVKIKITKLSNLFSQNGGTY